MAKGKKPNKVFRVFTTRHYIAVEFFDVKAPTPAAAAHKAKRAAHKLRPDPRAEATDNHWQAESPVELPRVAYPHGRRAMPMREVLPGVFWCID